MVQTWVGGIKGGHWRTQIVGASMDQLAAVWRQFGDSISTQWVPSHAGVAGNEEADVKGAKIAHQQLVQHKSVTDMWQDLGLQEVPDSHDSDSDQSGGSSVSEESEGGFTEL